MRRGGLTGVVLPVCALALAIVVAQALAAAGALDHSFSGDGRTTLAFGTGTADDVGNSVAIQNDGRFVVGGTSTPGGTANDFAAARFKPNGAVDTSFSGDGRKTVGFGTPNDYGNAVAIQRDGKVVIAGSTDSGAGPDFAVARLNPNGSLDQTFSGDGRKTFGFGAGAASGFAVVVQDDGRIVIAGDSDQGATSDNFAVARLMPNGGFDHTFSSDGRRTLGFGDASVDVANALVLTNSGRILLAGRSEEGFNGGDFAIARLKASGGTDNTFSGDGRTTVTFGNAADAAEDVDLQADGRIVLAGSFYAGFANGNEFAVARLKPNGGVDNTFSTDGRRTLGFGNAGGDDFGTGAALQADGRIVLAGRSDQGASGFLFAVARLKPTGGVDNAFSGDGRKTIGFQNGTDPDLANDVAIHQGKILVVGRSYQGGDTSDDYAIAQLLSG
jgi:uncharacterized delta-60 repeat protein